jgi:signal transduction histidine kinase
VTDSGQGIDETVVKQLFQPFVTTKPVGEGTGLGLSISKRIVESHDGRLFYNGKNAHTQFVMQLPLHGLEAA